MTLTDDEIRDMEAGLPEYLKSTKTGEIRTRAEWTAAGVDPADLIPCPIVKD